MNYRLPTPPALLLALVLPLLGLVPLSAGAAERGPLPYAPIVQDDDSLQARVIVKYRAGSLAVQALSAGQAVPVRPQHAASLALRLRLPLADGRVLGSRTQGLHGSGLSSSQLAAQLAGLPEVEWAVPDQRRGITAVPNDPYFGPAQTGITPEAGQWYLRAPDATLVSAINATGAWDITSGSPGVTVAVLDTGVRLDHPDLAGKLRPGYDFVRDAATGNDGDGRDPDASDPGDWTNASECGIGSPASNSRWHGTQVSGLIAAATNNGIGMAGAGRDVMVLPVRVLGRCGGYDSDIIAAMRWAAGLSSDVGFGSPLTVVNNFPAKIVNMSLGSVGACPASYREAVAELNAAGVSVVVAAGNDAGRAVNTPANCAGAIAVAGVRHTGSKVGYSNVGPEVTVAAPAGNCVTLAGSCLYPLLTTDNTGTREPLAHSYSDGANPTLGTSFAAPLVSGTLALMLSAQPGLSPAQLKALLQSSARSFPVTGGDPAASLCRAPNGVDQAECYCTTSTCGAGLLDAGRAVALAATTTPAPVAVAPAPVAEAAGGSGGGALGGGTLLALCAVLWAALRGRTRAQCRYQPKTVGTGAVALEPTPAQRLQ